MLVQARTHIYISACAVENAESSCEGTRELRRSRSESDGRERGTGDGRHRGRERDVDGRDRGTVRRRDARGADKLTRALVVTQNVAM